MHLYALLATAAIGIGVGLIVGYIRLISGANENRSHTYTNQTYTLDEDRTDINLLCSYCGRPVNKRDFKLNCGHYCHHQCYRNDPSKFPLKRCIHCNETGEKCNICFIPLRDGFQKLQCGHKIHKECSITSDVVNCGTCSLDRQEQDINEKKQL